MTSAECGAELWSEHQQNDNCCMENWEARIFPHAALRVPRGRQDPAIRVRADKLPFHVRRSRKGTLIVVGFGCMCGWSDDEVEEVDESVGKLVWVGKACVFLVWLST
jgi:hypothetical protein